MSLKRRTTLQLISAATVAMLIGFSSASPAAEEAPDALIERLTKDALDTIEADKRVQAGDVARIIELVDEKVMPYLNFQRMTKEAIGPAWRDASAEQRKRLETEFKTLLVRTYAGAMSQAKNLRFKIKPLRADPADKEVVVRTQILGRGDPVQLDYRLEKTPGVGSGWKIYNLNAAGFWMVESFHGQFKPEINAKGLDGLISTLTERNKSNAASDAKSVKPAKG